jgi:hypothetical protein
LAGELSGLEGDLRVADAGRQLVGAELAHCCMPPVMPWAPLKSGWIPPRPDPRRPPREEAMTAASSQWSDLGRRRRLGH